MTLGWSAQSLIDAMLEAVWVVDATTLHLIAVNPQAARMLELTPQEMIGRPVLDFATTPEDAFYWEDIAAGHQQPIRSDSQMQARSGQTVHVERRVSQVVLDEQVFFLVGLRDQTQERRAERELEKLVAELRATLESTADGILVTDMEGSIRSYNQHFARLWNLPFDVLTRRDDAAVYDWMASCVQDVQQYDQRLHAIRRSPLLEVTDVLALHSGQILERVTLPQYARGRPVGRVFSFRDITQRLKDDAQRRLAAKVFEASLDAVLIADPQHQVVAANPLCEGLLGKPVDQLLGQGVWDLLREEGSEGIPPRVQAGLELRGHWVGEMLCQHPSGNPIPGHVSVVRVTDSDGELAQIVVFFRDVSDKLADKARIEELAYSDSLTGLPNRSRFAQRVSYLLPLLRRTGGQFAVAFVDLDRFKQINDSLGHPVGDQVLMEVARRLQRCVREVDIVARLGGDEFVMLLNQVNEQGAEAVIQRTMTELGKPFELGGLSFSVTSSIGVAMYPQDGLTVDDLIKHADTAMYRVKDHGRSGYRFYQPQMNVDLLARMKMDHAMRQGLDLGEFSLHFQPQWSLADDQLVGAEALLRWNSAELGLVPPSRFIPVAEDSGFIVRLGDWVLEQGVLQAALWAKGGQAMRVSVNVSALQFQQIGFVARVADLLQQHHLQPHCLELELTESILVKDIADTLDRLQALSTLGVSLAIDDFGTGYSSLAYLKRLPIHRLKIDRSFVTGLPNDVSDSGIVRAVTTLALSLGLKVVAEGVETPEQHAFLRDVGCHEFQGYLRAAPMSVADFEAFRRTLPML